MQRYAYINAKLNILLQQKGNETTPTIKQRPLKTNTLTVTANKVNDAAASNAITLSVGKEKSEKKKNKTRKEKKGKEASDYNERLELQRKITKLINWFPKSWMATATSTERVLTTIEAKLRKESQETSTGIFCADAVIMV